MLWLLPALAAPTVETGSPVVTGSSRSIGIAGSEGSVGADPTDVWHHPVVVLGEWSSPRASDLRHGWGGTVRLSGWSGVLFRQLGPPGVDDPGNRSTQGQHLLQAMQGGVVVRKEQVAIAVALRFRSTLRDVGVPRPLRRRGDGMEIALQFGWSEGRFSVAGGPTVHGDRLCGLLDSTVEPVVCGPLRASTTGIGGLFGARAVVSPDRLHVGVGLNLGSVPVAGKGDVRFVESPSLELSGAVALTDAGFRPGTLPGRALQVTAAVRATPPLDGCNLTQIDDTAGRCAGTLRATLQPALAVEGEPIEDWLRLRGGAYLEPSRAGIGARPHVTAGGDLYIGEKIPVFRGIAVAADFGWPTERLEGHYLHWVVSPTMRW